MSGQEEGQGAGPASSATPQYQSISISVPPPSSRSSSNNLLALAPNATLPRDTVAGPGPVCTNDLDVLIKKLQDQSERDDTKLKVLQELWDSFDSFTSLPQYSNLMENLVRVFLKLFSETSAQFIAENNTQQLRKLMLEIILRTTGHEVMRHFSKQIQSHMIKIVQTDNEVNAILGAKILVDHMKLSRLATTPETQVTNLMSYIRKCFNDMQLHVQNGRMFEQRSRSINNARATASVHAGEDIVIETSLQQCFAMQQLNLDTKGSSTTNLMFQLIPRSCQSVKVLGEVMHLIMLIYQQYKQAVGQEIIDLTNTLIIFANIRVPSEQVHSETRNQELLNEFHNAQVKALGFFAFIIRVYFQGNRQTQLVDCIVGNGERIISSTILLLETCPILVVNQRKDILQATKIFFSYEPLRSKFLHFLPRLFSEKLMIGPAFTANDILRKQMYEQLADLLHHLRGQLPYPVLCHATYVYSRCLHDPLLSFSTQSMSIRLIMNLCESFTNCETKSNEPARDIFFGILETIIAKLRVMVLYHLPLMFAAVNHPGGEREGGVAFRSCEFSENEMHPEEKVRLKEVIANEKRTSSSMPLNVSAVNLDEPALHCGVEGVNELEPRPSVNIPDMPPPNVKQPERGYTSVDSMLAATWTAAGPPMPVHEARSMVRFLIQASKFLISSLANTKKTDRALTPAEERDTCARLLKYGLQALDVFMLTNTGQLQGRSRDDKEVVDVFAHCFTSLNPDVFNEIFSNYTPFLIERIAVNNNLQNICNSFLVNPDTSARFGSILAQYLLKRMPEMAYATERAQLHLKLFKLIFSAISCTQQSAGNSASQNVEKMIKPWLHQIVRDSMWHALKGREPTNYFLLLRALFRSIGGGSQDVMSVYQEFLPLLPSLLSFLNRMQAGQHRMAMKELFVELCLTVPVRLSSLLPHLPLLMDPLVCSLSGQNGVSASTTTRGLRTLELCVDNLQPEYLHEHIAPVRAALIQGLWRVVSKSAEQQSAMLALKILGKFGASNRKMLSEPQPLQVLREAELDVLALRIVFERPPQLQLPGAAPAAPVVERKVEEEEVKMEVDEDEASSSHAAPAAPFTVPPTPAASSTDITEDGAVLQLQQQHLQQMQQQHNGMESSGSPDEGEIPNGPIIGELLLSDAVRTALDNLRWSSPPDQSLLAAQGNQAQSSSTSTMHYETMRRHAAALCRTILVAGLGETSCTIEENLERVRRKLEGLTPEVIRGGTLYRSTNEAARRMYVHALTGIAVFTVSVCGKDLRPYHIKFFSSVIKHLTVQTLIEQLEPSLDKARCMDGMVLVDVIIETLADPVKHDFVQAAVVMLRLLIETCHQATGNMEAFCSLPLLHFIIGRLVELCYGTSCVSRLGGATAIAYIIEELPRVLLQTHLEVLLRALVEVMNGLAYEVSSGAIEIAIGGIERMMVVIFEGRESKKGRGTTEIRPSFSQLTASTYKSQLVETDEKNEVKGEEKRRIILKMAEIVTPLLISADIHTHEQGVKFLDFLSELTGVTPKELTNDGRLGRMCAEGLCDFPGLSLWKQVGVLNAVGYALRNGIELEFPPGTNEMEVLDVYVAQLTRICQEDADTLLNRKSYLVVGASSPTIPHSACAKFLREAAMRNLCLSYALLPHRERIEGLGGERILRVVMEGIKERERGQREAAEEGVMEAHSIRALPEGVIAAEISQLMETINQKREVAGQIKGAVLSDVDARLFCCLIKLNGVLFNDHCFQTLMGILRAWDDGTRRSSSDLKQRTTADVEAIESVLEMMPHIPKRPRRGGEMEESGEEKMEVEEKEEEEEEDKIGSSIRSLLESRACPSDFVPVVASLASTMHAAFCISRSTFFSSGALVKFLSSYPIRTLRFFLSIDSLSVPARRALFKRVFEAEGAQPLRAAAAANPYLLPKMLKLQFMSPSSSNEDFMESEFNKSISPYDEKTMDYELLTIWMVDVWSRNDPTAYCGEDTRIIKALQEIWRSDDFKTRYMVKTDEQLGPSSESIRVQFMTTPKYEVPKLFASCFVRYLRENYNNLDLFCDLLFVFIGSFATDFSFVRNYLTLEVIPTYPLAWRRAFFSYVLSKFEDDKDLAVGNLHIARVMQYALTPVLHYAFERYDVEEIVGPRGEPVDNEPKNLVIRLSDIIHQLGKQFSDTMTLAMYHLSSLIVIHAPHYIHVNNRTSHSNRLRVFMLFAWPCLNSSSMDVTLKFMGHLFLCHIIEKFTINRKIVLQVYHSLTSASQSDTRDIIKKALDILTPQLPIRMDDGQVELVKAVKKALCEESHNIGNVFHCLQTVTRNFKTYFPIKNELLPQLLNGVTRLLSYQTPTGFVDGRRLAVEVCEMIMKWEILRKQKLEELATGKPSPVSVEKTMEQLKRVDKAAVATAATAAAGAAEGGGKGEERKEEVQKGAVAAVVSATLPTAAAHVGGGSGLSAALEEQLKPMHKDHMDLVVNTLFKIATVPANAPNSPPSHIQVAQELQRRAASLLRGSLKPQLWGECASIRIPWVEKQMTITKDHVEALQAGPNLQRTEHAQLSAHLLTAAQTLEVLGQLTTVMPRQLALATIRPLQKAIISCLMLHNTHVIRASTSLLTRLMDASGGGECGLEDYEVLSQFVSKYINDQFVQYERNSTSMIQSIFTAFNLLRSMFAAQPTYVDTMMIQNMMKVLMKAAREYLGWQPDATKEKMVVGICDTATLALDMIRPRIGALTLDQRRQLATSIIHPFVETNSDKLLECIIRITRELVVSHTDDLTANPGLSIVVKLANVIRNRFRSKMPQYVELAKLYLQQLVLYIFEHDVLRRTEYAAKLEDSFYWGLTSPVLMMDDSTRMAFLHAFEKHVPFALPARLMFIFAQHDWTLMRDTFWIKHALYLILKAAFPTDPSKPRSQLNFREAATFGQTMDTILSGVKEEKKEEDERMEEEEKSDKKYQEILGERKIMLGEASGEGVQRDILNSLIGFIWAVQDSGTAKEIFIRLFTSIWANLHPIEREQLQNVLPYFLSSATHMTQTNQTVSSLSVIMEALSKCEPPFPLAPPLVRYVASRHRTYYLGLMVLEEEAAQCEVLTGRMKEIEGPLFATRFSKQLDTLESLNSLYSDMNESDQQIAVWKKRAFMRETVEAAEAMGKGQYNYALNILEDLQEEHLQRLEMMVPKRGLEDAVKEEAMEEGEQHVAVPIVQYETEAWMRMHTECLMSLGHWDEVEELSNISNQADAKTLLRAASHRQDPFLVMRQCKEQLTACLPPDFLLQFHYYSALIAVMDGMNDNWTECRSMADRATEEAFALGVSRWRLLPSAIGVSHLRLLQMAHLVQDLSDASAVVCALHPTQQPFNQQLIGELKGVIKTWRTWNHALGPFNSHGGTYNSYRTPGNHDDLPATADFFNIRKRVFTKLSRTFDDWTAKGAHTQVPPQLSLGHIPLPSHSLVHTQIIASRAFRSAKLWEQAEHTLNVIHTETSMPMASMVAKVVEHVKLLRIWARDKETSRELRDKLLRRALQVTEEVSMDEMCKEFFGRIYAQRAAVLGEMRDFKQARKCYEVAAALQEQTGHCFAYTVWAKHLDGLCHEKRASGDLKEAGEIGVQAVLCYVESAKYNRVELDAKARRYIARAIWLARLIAEVSKEEAEALPTKLERAARTCIVQFWIEWLPQLCLDIKLGIGCLGGFVAACARIDPIHTYYALREHLPSKSERQNAVETAARNPKTNCTQQEEHDKGEPPQEYYIFPTIKELCGLAAERRPADVLAMERMYTAIDEIKDVWAERQLRTVIEIQKEIFKSLDLGVDGSVYLVRGVGERVRKWREGLEGEKKEGWRREIYLREIDIRKSLDERLSEEEGEREEIEFILMVTSSLLPVLSREGLGMMELGDATIGWRKILERRVQRLPKTIPIRLAAPYLASFCAQTATIDLPGDMLRLKSLLYMSMVSRIGSHYEIGVRGEECVKSISMRSHGGKIVNYMIRKRSRAPGAARPAPSRVPQMMKAMDLLVQNDRGTSSRFLKVIPPVVAQCGGSELIEYATVKECGFYMDEIYSGYIKRELGMRMDEVVMECEKEKRRLMREEGEGRRTEGEARAEVYRTMCARVPSDVLLKFVQTRVPDPTNFYLWRKAITLEWAALAALEFALPLAIPSSSSILMEMGTGKSVNPDYRMILPKGSEQNVQQPVPFRLTENMNKMMGFTREGHFSWSLLAMINMLDIKKPEVYLRPLIWDCVAGDKCHISEVNKRTERVIEMIKQRVRVANEASKSSGNDAFGLVERARDPNSIARLPSYIHPWF